MKLAYGDTGGAGAGVVLLHGHPFDRSLWQPQLAALAGEFRVLAPDLRGFGDSAVTPGQVSMREYADDVLGLLEEPAVGRAAIVGLSMGGLVAMELATQPRRVAEHPIEPAERSGAVRGGAGGERGSDPADPPGLGAGVIRTA